jgi:hexokinase
MIIGIFTHFFALETTLAERQFFRALAKLIGKRSARLSACGIAAIVNKKGLLEEGCSVGADGSLYNVCIAVSRTRVDSWLILGIEISRICRQGARRTPGRLRRQRTVSRSGATYHTI